MSEKVQDAVYVLMGAALLAAALLWYSCKPAK
jgi:hypothetical protein